MSAESIARSDEIYARLKAEMALEELRLALRMTQVCDRVNMFLSCGAGWHPAAGWQPAVLLACNCGVAATPGRGRLLLYGKRNRRYKIYFAIHKETETIRVFHVRHWARKPADTGELDDLTDDSAEQDG